MNFKNIIFYNNKFLEITPDSRESNGILEIQDYLDGGTIASFPNLKSISKAAGGARNLQKRWNGLSREDRIDMLISTGERLIRKSEYDELISKSGGFPVRYVEETRKTIGSYLKNSEEFLQENPGRGPVAAATSVTAPIVQPFVIMEALFGNCSITIKGDGKEPFSAYMLADISTEIGLPIQFITYKTGGSGSLSYELYNMCEMNGGHFILMGDPTTPKKIAYNNIMDKIDIGDLPMPRSMIAFTSHGGAMIIDDSCDIEKAAQGAIDSFKFPRACKVPTGIFVSDSILIDFIEELCKIVQAQKTGNVLRRDTNVAEVSERFWSVVVDDFLRAAKSVGEVVCGGKINQPTIIRGNFYSSLSMEPQFPVYCVEGTDDLNMIIKKINDYGAKFEKRRILDLSIYTKNDELFQKLSRLRRIGSLNAFSLHRNLPTLSQNPNTAHEGIILREFLSEPNFIDS